MDERAPDLVAGYRAKLSGEVPIEYGALRDFFAGHGVQSLNNRLSPEENERLFHALDTAEIIALLDRGLAGAVS